MRMRRRGIVLMRMRRCSIKRGFFYKTLADHFERGPLFTAILIQKSFRRLTMNIEIHAGKDKASSSVKVTGTVQHVITDEERQSFKLEDAQLKDAVKKYFGKRPNDAFLHSPTPWDDLYKTYG